MIGTIIVIFLVWVDVWGAICAYIADHQGRSGGIAFLMGFLFGPIAVIVYAIMGRTLEKQAIDQLAVEKKLAQLRGLYQ